MWLFQMMFYVTISNDQIKLVFYVIFQMIRLIFYVIISNYCFKSVFYVIISSDHIYFRQFISNDKSKIIILCKYFK